MSRHISFRVLKTQVVKFHLNDDLFSYPLPVRCSGETCFCMERAKGKISLWMQGVVKKISHFVRDDLLGVIKMVEHLSFVVTDDTGRDVRVTSSLLMLAKVTDHVLELRRGHGVRWP
jgi:hypothetical protein